MSMLLLDKTRLAEALQVLKENGWMHPCSFCGRELNFELGHFRKHLETCQFLRGMVMATGIDIDLVDNDQEKMDMLIAGFVADTLEGEPKALEKFQELGIVRIVLHGSPNRN